MDALLAIIFIAALIIFLARKEAAWWAGMAKMREGSFSDFDLRRCWRFIVSVLFACGATLLIVNLKFPDAGWRDQLWVGVGIALLPGLAVGGVWQRIACKSLSKVLRKNLFWWGFGSFLLLASVFLFDAIPTLKQQQLSFEQLSSIHGLSEGDILQANITFGSNKKINITEPEKIEAFKKFLADAKVRGRGDVDSSEKLRIEIQAGGDSVAYDAFIPTSHPDDIMLKFATRGKDYIIRLPGLKRWLDENIIKEKN